MASVRRARTPLAGRSILLTRSRGSTALSDRLSALGARVDSRPTVELVPPTDDRACREALRDLARYDWLLFTSANGVRFFFDARQRMVAEAAPIDARVAAIGGATAAALEQRGVSPTVTASDSDSEGLAAALEGAIVPGARVLLVRPERARQVLDAAVRAMGAELDSVPFYRNVAPADVAEIASAVAGGRYEVVVFHSPSALSHLLEAHGRREATLAGLRRAAIVAIGGVTSAALARAGIEGATVAQRATDDGIVDAVCSL